MTVESGRDGGCQSIFDAFADSRMFLETFENCSRKSIQVREQGGFSTDSRKKRAETSNREARRGQKVRLYGKARCHRYPRCLTGARLVRRCTQSPNPSASDGKTLAQQRRHEGLKKCVGVADGTAVGMRPVDPDLHKVVVIAGQHQLAEQ